MTHFPWAAELQLEPNRAGALARRAFGIRCADVEKLAEGFDYISYLADGEWVLRFPKRAECDGVLVREREILKRMHNLPLPVPVPGFEYFSSPLAEFPWHFAAYRYLSGTPLTDISDAAILNDVAAEVGEFLAVLHRARIATEVPSPWAGQDYSQWALREFRHSADAYSATLRRRLDAYLQDPLPPEPEVPLVLAHADLLADHILVDPATSALAGIIDWADACTTIRSADFGGLFYAGGRECAARAFWTYGAEPDDDEWRWLEHKAIMIAVGEVHYGYLDNHPKRVSSGLERIRRYLPLTSCS